MGSEQAVPQCAGCFESNHGVEHRVCSSCLLKTKTEAWGLRKSHDVEFTLPPFEAGILLGVCAWQLQQESRVDDPADPLRRTAIQTIWKTLTEQLRDWQKARS